MKKRWLLALVFAYLLFIPSLVFAVDFDILSYQGDLNIHADNTAEFREKVVYYFDEDFNGQLVGLGRSGKMPKGFEIDPSPKVQVWKNASAIENVNSEVIEESEGYTVKVYNPGQEGDTVEVVITWQLKNLLFLYDDIAELNWQPLTDSSEPIENFEFRVTGFNGAEKLFFHTGKLFTEGKVEKTGGDYRVHLQNLPRQRGVELHAYWPRKDFGTDLDQGLKGNRLAEFKK